MELCNVWITDAHREKFCLFKPIYDMKIFLLFLLKNDLHNRHINRNKQFFREKNDIIFNIINKINTGLQNFNPDPELFSKC